jgi:hypothetical protein
MNLPKWNTDCFSQKGTRTAFAKNQPDDDPSGSKPVAVKLPKISVLTGFFL